MRRVILGAVCAAMLSASAALVAQGKQDFTLVNKTGLTISEFYVSPSDDNEWGEDVLGKDVLADNEKVHIKFARKEKDCAWDLKIVDDEEDEVVWTDIDLCTSSEITLKYEGKKPTAIIK